MEYLIKPVTHSKSYTVIVSSHDVLERSPLRMNASVLHYCSTAVLTSLSRLK